MVKNEHRIDAEANLIQFYKKERIIN